MSFLIVLRFDSAGACPVVVHEDDELFASDGATWRLVAQTNDPAEAARLVDQLRQRAAELTAEAGACVDTSHIYFQEKEGRDGGPRQAVQDGREPGR